MPAEEQSVKSREAIFGRLRAARQPFAGARSFAEPIPTVPRTEPDAVALEARFVREAEKINCVVHHPADAQAALEAVLRLIADDQAVLAWAPEHIPLPGLAEALAGRGITIAGAKTDGVRVGITGAAAALAATGTLVVSTGEGRGRLASLLPDVHIAVVRREQILPDIEAWFAHLRATDPQVFRAASNHTLISGPSRTGDIGGVLVLGAHGPVEVHVVLV